MPVTHLLTHVRSHEPGAPIPPSLTLALSARTVQQILRAQDAAQALSEDGEEVYGIDVVCGDISASPLRLEGVGAVSPYRAGLLNVQPLSSGAGLLGELPPDQEAGAFWVTCAIDVRGLRVTETSVRLFAWAGSGRWRMESERIDIGALVEMFETRNGVN